MRSLILIFLFGVINPLVSSEIPAKEDLTFSFECRDVTMMHTFSLSDMKTSPITVTLDNPERGSDEVVPIILPYQRSERAKFLEFKESEMRTSTFKTSRKAEICEIKQSIKTYLDFVDRKLLRPEDSLFAAIRAMTLHAFPRNGLQFPQNFNLWIDKSFKSYVSKEVFTEEFSAFYNDSFSKILDLRRRNPKIMSPRRATCMMIFYIKKFHHVDVVFEDIAIIEKLVDTLQDIIASGEEPCRTRTAEMYFWSASAFDHVIQSRNLSTTLDSSAYQNFMEKTLEYYEKAIEVGEPVGFPNLDITYRNLANYLAYRNDVSSKRAAGYYHKLIDLGCQDPHVIITCAKLYKTKFNGTKDREAIELCERLTKDPTNKFYFEACLQLADLMSDRKKPSVYNPSKALEYSHYVLDNYEDSGAFETIEDAIDATNPINLILCDLYSDADADCFDLNKAVTFLKKFFDNNQQPAPYALETLSLILHQLKDCDIKISPDEVNDLVESAITFKDMYQSLWDGIENAQNAYLEYLVTSGAIAEV